MKTITMDWETYQKELGEIETIAERAFDRGARASEERLKPLLDYLRDVHLKTHFSSDLHDLMVKVGEL